MNGWSLEGVLFLQWDMISAATSEGSGGIREGTLEGICKKYELKNT